MKAIFLSNYIDDKKSISREQPGLNFLHFFMYNFPIMVVTAGCYYEGREFAWYDSDTQQANFFKLEKEYCSDSLADLFLEIKHNIYDSGCLKLIDYFCVYMGYKYTNNVRKTFLEYAKTQIYINNVRIIGYYHALLCDAVEILPVSPVNRDSLLMFFNYEKYFESFVWEFNEENGWQLKQFFQQEKTFKKIDKPPTLMNLEELKTKIHVSSAHPYIWVQSKCHLNEEEFVSVFTNYKEILIKNSDWFASLVALNFARYLTNENGFSKYKIEPFLDELIVLKYNDEEAISIPYFTTIPCKRLLNCTMEVGDFIEIFENYVSKTIIQAESKVNFELVIDVDDNGIFTLCTKKIIFYEKLDEGNRYYSIPKVPPEYIPGLNAIGIDFGTTECCTAVIRRNGADFVVLDSVTSSRTMPSYVAFDEEKPKCGQIVIDRMRYKSEYSVFDIKRIMGKYYENISIDELWPFEVVKEKNEVFIETQTFFGNVKKSPDDVSAVLLAHIKEVTETYQNAKLNKAVIAIPSKFTQKQQQSLTNAAEMAGWTSIDFLPEPVAAAFAYFREYDIPPNSHILTFDCGGGTIDICVAKVLNDQLRVLNFDGDPYLGGRDFDNILFTHFNGILKHKFDKDVMKNYKKYVLHKKCQEIKHTLSSSDEDWINVDDFDYENDQVIKITKVEFEAMSLPLMVKMKNIILRALEGSYIPNAKNAINYVFQVGGGSRMPMIKKLLIDIFPNSNHECTLYPDWVVAHGTALYAYQVQKAKKGIVVTHPDLAPSWLSKHFKLEFNNKP